MLSTLAVAGYRSLRDLAIPLKQLNLLTGANGTGKSNVYRALRLLAESAQGRVIPSLAREGGLQSSLWAGPESFSRSVLSGDQPVVGTARKRPVSLRLGFTGDDFGYTIELGLPPPQPGADAATPTAFGQDPEIKRECVWSGSVLRPSTLLVDRRGGLVRIRDGRSDWIIAAQNLLSFDSVMTASADPQRAPELLMLREHMRGWRFYDQLRTDATAPARLPQIGTRTPILSDDGADLAAALQTIIEIGDGDALNESVADAFPGSAVSVSRNGGWFEVRMQQHGLLRPLSAAELSDGTLRYLLWVAALLTPRPPELLVLNEPETSLHPDLLPALARLITRASERSQVFVVSHAPGLIDALQSQPDCHSITLTKRLGETQIIATRSEDEDLRPAWHWPAR
jgi:predicted ATPase